MTLKGQIDAVGSVLLLFLLISGISASVDTTLFRKRLESKRGIAVGLLTQFVCLPFFGFCSARFFDLDVVFGITLLFTTCSPGGAFSNWWCSVFNADLALSIAMTTCSTLASVVFMPFNLFLYVRGCYGTSVPIDWWALIYSLAVALLAIVFGLSLSTYLPNWRKSFNVIGNIAGVLLMATGIVTSSNGAPLWDKDLFFYISVAMPCCAGLITAYVVASASGLEGPQRVAVAVESCYQNTGIPLTLALATFEESERSRAVGVPLYYGVVEIILLPMFLVVAWKCGLTYAPANARLHSVVAANYQPSHCAETCADSGAQVNRSASLEQKKMEFDTMPPLPFDGPCAVEPPISKIVTIMGGQAVQDMGAGLELENKMPVVEDLDEISGEEKYVVV